ncbi:MAG: acyl-CoA synthetase [Alphaproteobacteria bacterium]|nr:acyl-CoA synthetase [Alphaproteobacteria bacterium]
MGERDDIWRIGLERNAANYAPLTPLSFLARTAEVYPSRPAVVHGAVRRSWAETYARSRRLASALARRGIGRNAVVAVMAPNIPPMVEAHFGVPMCGAVLNTLNTRLDAAALGFMLNHGGARVLLTDREFAPAIGAAVQGLANPPLVVDIEDAATEGMAGIGALTYEALLAEGDPEFAWQPPADEWDAISLNYTSGTTGDPKGVVYHHRGAYMNAISNILAWGGMGRHPSYLWTLPMFHCNGWCFPWSMAAVGGVNVCLRRVEGPAMLEAIRAHGVTHMCGAPIVYAMLVDAVTASGEPLPHPVHGQIAASAPPPALIEGCERAGIELTHVYGLTETYGPASVCAPQDAWSELSLADRAERLSRQGVRATLQEGMTVLDPETMQPVPADGHTMGEIFFRGNITMKGYLKNPETTAKSFAGGWFHTGDLAVLHPDGYAKIQDRSKDIIISGGENISSLEVEEALYRHPAVMHAAVVAQPDPKWGEVPCAVVELRPGMAATEAEIIEFCRARMARFKVPKRVLFREVPKTSTGKIQKHVLRTLVQETAG